MKFNIRFVTAFILLSIINIYSQGLESEIESLVKPLIDSKKNKSIAIGVYDIDSQTPRYFFYGSISSENPNKPNENTVFEIGSITKTFTAALLLMMERDGKIKVNDLVQNYLPKDVTLHQFSSNTQMKISHLVTHTSGLPRLPNNLFNAKAELKNPYKNYSAQDLYYFLNNYIPEYEPGTKFLYSNLGFGLLGHILTLSSAKTYNELLKYYITDSLGMSMTSVNISDEMKKNLAPGYNEKQEPAVNWDFDVMEGAGAIKSNISDMMKYLAFQLGRNDELDFKEGLKLMHTRRFETEIPNTAIGISWFISETGGDRTVIWHNGKTQGYASFIGFIPETNCGVAVLSNQANDVDNIGLGILKYINRLK
jgi:CubicO group peptidase (beta-lactamase class C family)